MTVRDVAKRIGADPDRAAARWVEHGVPNRWIRAVRAFAKSKG